MGIALDAASRGYKTLLLEGYDFAKGTSSRSTKLVHGGVRYLAAGDVALVKEALRERGRLSKNASHLFKNQNFIIPNYNFVDSVKYRIGLGLYDYFTAEFKFWVKRLRLIKDTTMQRLPTLNGTGLKNGVVYKDGQF